MIGKCAKTEVEAFVVTEGARYWGYNSCRNPQKKCPRKKGEGYEKCKSICKQISHAEIAALKNAGKDARGATMYLVGHDHLCEECQKACDKSGIKHIVVLKTELIAQSLKED